MFCSITLQLWVSRTFLLHQTLHHQLFKRIIPKCSVVCWLPILNRLSTEDRLVLFGIKPTSCWSLCPGIESHDHRFFNCPFSEQVCDITSKPNVTWTAHSWSNWIRVLSSCKGKSLRVTTIKLAFTVTVYQLWRERNFRKFQNISCSVHVVTHKICNEVRLRLLSLAQVPQGARASWFFNAWNLSFHNCW